MMKKVYLIVSIMFLVSTGIILTACSSDDDSSTTYSEADLQKMVETRMGSANQNALPDEELPEWIKEWMQEKTASLSKDKEFYNDFSKMGFLQYQYRIYQCKWNEEVFYFIYPYGDSCFWCNAVYSADGTKRDWASVEDTKDFVTNSTSWRCVVDLLSEGE